MNLLQGNYEAFVRTRLELLENQMKQYNWEQDQIAHMKVRRLYGFNGCWQDAARKKIAVAANALIDAVRVSTDSLLSLLLIVFCSTHFYSLYSNFAHFSHYFFLIYQYF